VKPPGRSGGKNAGSIAAIGAMCAVIITVATERRRFIF